MSERKLRKYLLKVSLKKLRGFTDQDIYFDFPVTALIGVNGGGKTTILGSAGLAYISIEPKIFFARGGNYDPAMKDWRVQFEYLDKDSNPNALQTSASYKKSKWDRKKLERSVVFFGVTRTVPANERKELRKCSSGSFKVDRSKISELEDLVKQHAGRILGKKLEGFRQMEISDSGQVKFLAGQLNDGTSYSEFHFGAGESSVIRIVSQLEAAENYSLALIEEIENGLHPVAATKLVEYLIDVAKRKNIQTVFTTHSNSAISPLPHKAVWAITDSTVRQGKLDIESLRALTGKIDKDAVIFVEDKFAGTLVQCILRQHNPLLLSRSEIHAMEGDSIAKTTTLEHNRNPAIKAPAVCVLDGDSSHEESLENNIVKMEGNAPEIEIFGKVLEAWDSIGGRLTVALNYPPEKQAWVRDQLEKVRIEVGDHHLLFLRASEKLCFLPIQSVEQAFCNIFAQHYYVESSRVAEEISRSLGLSV